MASVFCRTHYEGGGTCIMLKNGLEYTKCFEIESLAIEYVIEICAIIIPSLDIILIVMYWPNSSREVDTFITQLERILKLVQTKFSKKNVIIGGDLNVDFLSSTRQAKDLLKLFKSYNFYQNVKKPTRICKNSSTCLDIIFTNFDKQRLSIDIKEYGISDHKGVLINLLQAPPNYNNNYFTIKRIFNTKTMNAFQNKLLLVNWADVIKKDNTMNENFLSFHTKLTETLDATIPKVKVKNKQCNKKSWLTPGIKKACRNKRFLKLLVAHFNEPIINDYYKKYEKTLKKTVITSKRINYIKRMSSSKNKTKSMWQIIKEKNNKINKSLRQNITLKINDNSITSPYLVANTLNSYYLSMGSNNIIDFQPTVSHTINNTMYLNPTSPQEVRRIIKRLKNKTSCGFDELPPTLIKHCQEELVMPLTYLINQSFSEATFPSLLKKSIIKPVPKTKTAQDVTQYRPIALLSTFSKVFETAMCNQLTSFCEKFNIFDSNQHGFRKGKSTVTALVALTREILDIINNHKYAISIMLDMSKAYDRVSHKILLNKLYSIGIRGQAYKWFTSYLENRRQCVEIEHLNGNYLTTITSQVLDVKGSIPQGSVLGCILFLIYVNDLPKVIKSTCVLYADDITVVFPCDKSDDLTSLLDSVLTPINNWLKNNNLELNLSKTKLMQFKPRQKNPLNINVEFNDVIISSVGCCTLLGVDFDSGLSWKYHIEKMSGKLSRFTYALLELKRSTDLNTAKAAYYAYAYAWLNYGIVLWGNATEVNQLFVLQKRCIRIMVNINNRESCRNHFKELGILTLTSMYILEICKFVKNNIKQFQQTRNPHSRSHNLRHENKLTIPCSKLELVHSGIHYMSIKIYNKLPLRLKSIENNVQFVNDTKEFLLCNCFYNIQEFFAWSGK